MSNAEIKKTVRIDENADSDVSFSPRTAGGQVYIIIGDKSVEFIFDADTVEDFSPAEYEDGYLVWDEELVIESATITKLEVGDSYLIDEDGDEIDDANFSIEDLTAEQRKEVEDLIEGEILGSENLDLDDLRKQSCPY